MNGSAAITNTATVICPENPFRIKICIVNNSAINTVWVGQGGATTSTGICLFPKASLSDERDAQGHIFKGAWVGVSDVAGPTTITYIEENIT